MQGLPIDQKMPLCFGVAAGFLLFLGVLQVVFSYFVQCICRLVSGLGFLRLWVFASGNEAEKSLRLSTRHLGRPRRTMATYGDEPLTSESSIFNDIDRIASLPSNPEPFHRFFMVSVPNRLVRLQRLNCSNRYAF